LDLGRRRRLRGEVDDSNEDSQRVAGLMPSPLPKDALLKKANSMPNFAKALPTETDKLENEESVQTTSGGKVRLPPRRYSTSAYGARSAQRGSSPREEEIVSKSRNYIFNYQTVLTSIRRSMSNSNIKQTKGNDEMGDLPVPLLTTKAEQAFWEVVQRHRRRALAGLRARQLGLAARFAGLGQGGALHGDGPFSESKAYMKELQELEKQMHNLEEERNKIDLFYQKMVDANVLEQVRKLSSDNMDWQSYAENSIKRIYDEVLGKGTDFQQAIQLHSPVPPPPLPTKRSSYGTAAKKTFFIVPCCTWSQCNWCCQQQTERRRGKTVHPGSGS